MTPDGSGEGSGGGGQADALQALRQEAYAANMLIPYYQLARLTWGNVSVYDPEEGVIAIKPSGVGYDVLQPEDMVVVDLERKIHSGRLHPSSDTATHVELYRAYPQLRSIVHTHSPYAVAWAQALKAIPIYGTTHADQTVHDVPCTPSMEREYIEGDYELETGRQIIRHLAAIGLSPDEVEMVLVGSHGPFVWGRSAEKAVQNAVALEEIARMAFLTWSIDSEASRLSEDLRHKHYMRKHGPNAYYGQA